MSIHHVALETRRSDVDAERRFWALLGFEEVDPPPTLRERATWVQREGTQIHLLYADDPFIPPQGHTAVVAPDYAEATARLRSAGIEIEERAPHWGAPRCVVLSPGGHRVEVMAAPPG
jgi:catechol 2,3-dioxygenase-like lactoylglutathione lyase family enzyme